MPFMRNSGTAEQRQHSDEPHASFVSAVLSGAAAGGGGRRGASEGAGIGRRARPPQQQYGAAMASDWPADAT